MQSQKMLPIKEFAMNECVQIRWDDDEGVWWVCHQRDGKLAKLLNGDRRYDEDHQGIAISVAQYHAGQLNLPYGGIGPLF